MKKSLYKYLMIFISALLAGVFIAFGATTYLICTSHDNYAFKILGSFLFGIGLFTIIVFKLWLYTGKVGYLIDNKLNYLLSLFVCLIGNMIGVVVTSLIIKQTYVIDETVMKLVKYLVEKKNNESAGELFVLSIMCGIMIYIAVEGYSRCEHYLGKVLFAFMPIVIFVLCGFEHVVANGCYYTYYGEISWKVFGWFLLIALGNAVGSILISSSLKFIKYLSKKSEGI